MRCSWIYIFAEIIGLNLQTHIINITISWNTYYAMGPLNIRFIIITKSAIPNNCKCNQVMEERNNKFWNQIELKLNSLSSSWDEEINKVNQDFSMKEALDITLEKEVGCALTIVGPLLDSYLKAFGKGMLNRLSRSHHTGLQKPLNLLLPVTNSFRSANIFFNWLTVKFWGTMFSTILSLFPHLCSLNWMLSANLLLHSLHMTGNIAAITTSGNLPFRTSSTIWSKVQQYLHASFSSFSTR